MNVILMNFLDEKINKIFGNEKANDVFIWISLDNSGG
jgi:hypothetical protein